MNDKLAKLRFHLGPFADCEEISTLLDELAAEIPQWIAVEKAPKNEVIIFYWCDKFYETEILSRRSAKLRWVPAFNLTNRSLSPHEIRSLRNVEVWLIPDQNSSIQVSCAENLRNELNKYGVVQITKKIKLTAPPKGGE
jgi:hypothetical protein